ncbi:hypothetical protein M408DRAFT_121993 [Serendipita vermifera MAFF 305830]|uniref:Uncharacterized protein n=1 Tax=Serendipita vermifera MAFF 305830 TaxID=933852 RepID=A0A0C3AXP3_SERVB|nr:hypothetical protein M408DRAFT_121993 [Serendipita vermifera MAFF 305830]
MKQLFRNPKPTKRDPTYSNAPRPPPPSSAGTSILHGGDVSSRIQPYRFGTPSPPPPASATNTSTHAALHTYRQGYQQHDSNPYKLNIPASAGGGGLTGDDPSRGQSRRVRPSQEDPWVVVNSGTYGANPMAESRFTHTASLIQPVLGATGSTAPYISYFHQQQHQQREPLGKGSIDNESNTAIPSSSPIDPPSWARNPQPPSEPAQSIPPPTFTIPQPSSHQDKSWSRGLFGTSTSREKEANAEMLKMIGEGTWASSTASLSVKIHSF